MRVAKKKTPKKTAAKKTASKKSASKKTAAKPTKEKKPTKKKPAKATVNEVIINSILEKKGEKVVSIDLKKIPDTATDFFIICEADSTTQVRAIANNIVEQTRSKLNERAWHMEGAGQSEWVLIDYVSTVVHIFLKSSRQFYQLEDLWSDGIIKQHHD